MPPRGLGILNTRVGRRTLAIFVVSVILPVAALVTFSYLEIRDALLERTRARVESSAKEHAVGVVGRAISLRDYFTLVATGGTGLPERDAANRIVALGIDTAGTMRLEPEAEARVTSGETALALTTGAVPAIRLVRQRQGSGGDSALVWGEAPISELGGFSSTEELDPMVCILEQRHRRILQCSAGVTAEERAAARANLLDAPDGTTLATTRQIFLTYEVGGGNWEAVAFRRRSDALAPMQSIGRTFALVAVLSMLVVFFASHVQIRRITEPLERLSAATRAVRDGEYRATVDVSTDDEFGELATSFNAMSQQLGHTFDSLAAVDAVDRAALSSRDIGEIIDIAQRHVLSTCAAARVVVLTPSVVTHGDTWFLHELAAGQAQSDVAREVPRPPALPDAAEEFARAGIAEHFPGAGVTDKRTLRWLCLPLRNQGVLEGIMAVGSLVTIDQASAAAVEARRLGDRLAAALANVRLVRQLEAMSLGTLTAFARTVDTNSPWTAGHSERVTTMAVALGRRIGLASDDLDLLRRGGLLHDIGKIGVPASILDKAGPLTAEEFEVMRSHPAYGHRILSPIGALRDVLPMVRSHHERMDGAGYPDGLRGEEIPRLARVLAVADVFDALTSDRPYRSGMPAHEALAIIRRSGGAHLDPDMVRQFLELHAEGGVRRDTSAADPSLSPSVFSETMSEVGA
ncbi:MAG: HD domain-containing protein [Cytophagaceae bacterium]|nr:HD domain-containing protein [Gemmatimonadaceae bacterium]